MMWLRGALLAVALVAGFGSAASAQGLPPDPRTTPVTLSDAETTDITSQVHQLRHALVRLPIAAALACLLALRPRRRGTPKRQAPVVQTQIILAIVGAVVMLVVGSSLARAFGIVGAAGLVRYRAKIEDPKDAGVMLSTLAVGLAAGVGVYLLALFATASSLAGCGSWSRSSRKATQRLPVEGQGQDPAALTAARQAAGAVPVSFELRCTSTEELEYEVKMPLEGKTDKISTRIMELAPDNVTAVEWDEKKKERRIA